MELLLYKNFSKKKNSTKQPGTATKSLTVHTKQPTSIESPVFEVSTAIDLDYNYAKFAGHYYFIDDIVLPITGRYELHCSQDILATYKSAIGSLNTLIERSASDYNLDMNDSMISQSTKQMAYLNYADDLGSQSNPFLSVTTGCYAVRMVSEGITGVYLMTEGTCNSLMRQFTSEAGNPDNLAYLVGVSWLPLYLNFFIGRSDVTAVNRIVFNTTFTVETADNMYLIKKPIHFPIQTLSFNNPTVGYSGRYGDFRDYSTVWTKARIKLLGDYFSIDPAILRGSTTADYNLDVVAGDITVEIKASGYPVLSHSKHIAVDRQVSGTAFDGKRLASNIMQMGASAVTSSIGAGTAAVAGGAYAGMAAAGAAAISTAMQAAALTINESDYYHPSVLGSTGSASSVLYIGIIELDIWQYESGDVPTSLVGRPLNEYRTISTLTGFVKCAGASIELSGLGNDKDAVNAYLNNGFYYE